MWTRKLSPVTSTTLDVTTSIPQRVELPSAVPASVLVRPATTADLIEQLRDIDWFQFEKLVALAYEKLGYTVTRRGGANPDGGIDLVIEKDGQRMAVQCKQWKTWNVGVKAVREFLGALTDAGISKGIFITLRGYIARTSESQIVASRRGFRAGISSKGFSNWAKLS